MLQILRTNSDNADFQKLVILLDRELAERDGSDHSFYAQYNKIDSIKNVVIIFKNKRAIGCGAFKKFDGETAEIKRMYVLPEHRGQGIAGELLNELEKWASDSGYRSAILETGKKQPEAIRLYEKSGYQLIPNYGQYKNITNSVCMQKAIILNQYSER
jgi:GNAT superfamily N-acetyltransferase